MTPHGVRETLVIIGSAPMMIGRLETNFIEILLKTHSFPFA